MRVHKLRRLPRLIAITGQEGSGKDTYSEHLAELGYMHISAGDIMRERAKMEGFTGTLDRNILSQVGDRFKQEFGPSPITESSLRKLQENLNTYPSGLVISGLRRSGEIKAFKAHGAIVLWIDASIDKRYENQSSRARGDYQDIEAFTAMSHKEYFGTSQNEDIKVNLQTIEALADCRVKNESSIEELIANADRALAKFTRL